MKAVIVRQPGGLANLILQERDIPRPKADELLIRIRASSLNFHDYAVAKGILPVADGRILMSDGAGEVIEVGADIRNFAPGDKVVSTYLPAWLSGEADSTFNTLKPGENLDGYAAEYVAVPENWVTLAPAGYSHREAATLTCAGLTAWRCIFPVGKIKPGDCVLVQGTGGVSIFALQFAKLAGATVIATSSSPEKLKKLRDIGADHVVNYRETPQWGEAARELTGGRGVDLVVEVGGTGTLVESMVAARVSGRIAMVGALSGIAGEMPPLRHTISKQLDIKGVTVGSRADHLEMIRAIEANGMKPIVDSIYPLEQLADAYRHQESQKHFGKICIEI